MSKSNKAVAYHEVGTYKTDCGCGKHLHRTFRDGLAHLESCDKATTLYFCGHYEKPRAVATKEGGRIV